MKIIVRVSVVALVFAGAFANSFIPKTAQAAPSVSLSSMMVSSALPVPTCEPSYGCYSK